MTENNSSELHHMSVQFQSLLYLPPGALLEAFNESFKDYFVPVQLTEESLQQKINSENIRFHLSAGAFAENKLVGFILTGYDEINGKPFAYNAGTGVLPAWRGRGLTAMMYEFLFALLRERNIHHHVLEVIDENKVAQNVYKNCGFEIARGLSCCKGIPLLSSGISVNGIRSEKISAAQLSEAYSFADFPVTWQNSFKTIERGIRDHSLVGLWQGKKLVAAAAFVSKTGRVKFFAVEKNSRGKGIGTMLLRIIAEATAGLPIVFINIDTRNNTLLEYLRRRNISAFIGQQEMTLVR